MAKQTYDTGSRSGDDGETCVEGFDGCIVWTEHVNIRPAADSQLHVK